MTDLDREQLKRDCADALEALTKEQRPDGLADLADSLRALGPPYRSHGELLHGALRDGQDNAITWNLIHTSADNSGPLPTRSHRVGLAGYYGQLHTDAVLEELEKET